MSSQAVNLFLQKVVEDEQLQQELAQILESQDNDREAAAALAAKHGYQFSPDELWQELQNRQSEFEAMKNRGELNDSDLEAVAGGGTGLKQTTPAIASAASGVVSGVLNGVINSNARW